MKILLLALTVALGWTVSAEAIVIRHDRDEDAYRRLAAAYPMVCDVGGGTGTLIHPEWVLTAGHVAEGFSRRGGTLRFGDQEVEVAQTHIHPDFGRPGRNRDLALLRLATPVEGVAPAGLYAGSEEAGLRVTFVGSGYTGDGRTGPEPGERIFRAAHNVVERVDPGWLVFLFDEPPAGEELEGISGPGDSGGPALVEVEGQVQVAGVSAYNDGRPECRYNTREYYARVSDQLEWVASVMAGKAPEDDARVMRYQRDPQGRAVVRREDAPVVAVDAVDDAPLWEAIAALTAAFSARDQEQFLSLFSPAYVRAREEAGDPLTGLLEFMDGVLEGGGPIRGFHAISRQGAQLKELDAVMRPAVFHLEDGTPGYFGVVLDDEGRIAHLSLFVREGICQAGAGCAEVLPLEERRR